MLDAARDTAIATRPNPLTARTREAPKQAARRFARAMLDKGFAPAALHEYRDATGNPIYWRIRLKHPETGEKWIRPMRRNGNTYELGEPEFPNETTTLSAARTDRKARRPVLVCRGRTKGRCARQARAAGDYRGRRNERRARGLRPAQGRSVTIWPDSDTSGSAHAERVAAKLRALGCMVEMIDAAALDVPEGGDCVDWFKAHPGATAADLATLPWVASSRAAAMPAPTGTAQAWPEKLDEAAYYGLAGEIVRAIEPDTEADPVAILAQVLVAFGAQAGRGNAPDQRGPHCRVEADEHHPNLFVILCGATSKARKGTSWGRVHVFYRSIPEWPRMESGLSSGEGLKYAVRDPVMRPEKDKITGKITMEEADPGIADKRLLVKENEFAQALRQASRPGNVLSAVIREAWDTGNLRTLTKTDQVTATGAHICIIGHITADELRAELTATDTANGFANRFLFVATRRSNVLPFGGEQLAQDMLEGFTARLRAAATHARGLGLVSMTPAARSAWAGVYPVLSEGSPGLYGSVTARAEAQVLRLSLVYALLDSADQIDVSHLTAALAFWEYCAASAAFIFGDALGDPVADDLLAALRVAGSAGMTRTEIRDHFRRHQSRERINAALTLLQSRKRAAVVRRTDTGGAPAEIWKAA